LYCAHAHSPVGSASSPQGWQTVPVLPGGARCGRPGGVASVPDAPVPMPNPFLRDMRFRLGVRTGSAVPWRPSLEGAIMTRGYTLLALSLLLVSGSASWAGEIGRAQLPPDAAPAAPLVMSAPQETGCCGCTHAATCGNGYGAQHRRECWARLADWLTYCPPKCSCCPGCDSCCSGCCKQCTPCCTPPYMYFLDRCSCTLGYRGPPPHALPHAPGAGPEGGIPNYSPPPPAYGSTATTGR
jgi:hypothetical protein